MLLRVSEPKGTVWWTNRKSEVRNQQKSPSSTDRKEVPLEKLLLCWQHFRNKPLKIYILMIVSPPTWGNNTQSFGTDGDTYNYIWVQHLPKPVLWLSPTHLESCGIHLFLYLCWSNSHAHIFGITLALYSLGVVCLCLGSLHFEYCSNHKNANI